MLWKVSLLLFSLTVANTAMAVDRSKFRTCEQTSFCRRHRHGAHQSLFRYKVVPNSVHFHHHDEKKEGGEGAEAEEEEHTGMWKAIQRRLKLTRGGEHHVEDPYVRGPPPVLTGLLQNTASNSAADEKLQWSITTLSSGMARMRVTEDVGSKKNTAYYENHRVTYDELVLETPASWKAAGHCRWIRPDSAENKAVLQKLVDKKKKNVLVDNYMALQYGDAGEDASHMILLIQMDPFVVSLYREDNLDAGPVVVLGAEQLMHFEVRRFKEQDEEEREAPKDKSKKEEESEEKDESEEKEEKEIVGYWEDGLAIYADGTREEKKEIQTEDHRQLTEAELDREGLWEESFGSHKDSKPYGPMSVGLDVSFRKSQHLYGIPEHASSAVLQTTTGDNAHYKEPYRLYNLDVFEYELDETMALYGHVPIIMSQSMATGSAGVFWFNPTETFVDILRDEDKSTSHWISESGIIDVFLLPGPDPPSLYGQYATLTGTTQLPPMFSLGYHQCRWNYKDEKDVYTVHEKFEELDYPYDVLWLDIEHTDGKRYFTWDDHNFPNPIDMQKKLASQGRRMVTIIDPHIKRDDGYYIHKEATKLGLYVKDKNGKKDYDGWCWPGSSSYLDFTTERVRSWWADQFAYNKYQGSTSTLFTWNDMNEPSVFNGPEVSMQKDLQNLNGEEHREWHNLYGMLFHRSTAEGLIRRNQPDEDVRPFVLSRSFFAGSQRYGAIWTGDNTAEWGHLEYAAPMLLSMNVAAISFIGADVGGFFGNPDAELFTRWMQAGAYQPFFRGHAHHDSKRREPWMFDEDTLVRLRRAAMARYALLPYWYTIFHEAHKTGMPVMRMMWMQYPKTGSLFSLDDQYLIGSDILVKPVIAEGVTESTVVFPTDHLWYDAESLALVSNKIAPKSSQSTTVPSDIDSIPVFQRGGSIIPRKLRLRRSTMMMKTDPFTIYVALDDKKQAKGRLYMDDEESFGYKKRAEFASATFLADLGGSNPRLSNSVSVGSGWSEFNGLADDKMIERIIIMGVQEPPKTISVEGEDLEFTFVASSKLIIVRKPELSALDDWTIVFS